MTIRRCELDRALEVVKRSGLADELDGLLRPVAAGRPRELPMDAFLAALLLAAHHKKALTLKGVHEVLTVDLPYSARVSLGVVRPSLTPGGRTRPITVRQVRYVLEALERRLAYTPGRVENLSDEERADRSARLQRIVDRLLAATMPQHIVHTGAYALDETGLWSWCRGSRKACTKGDGSDDALKAGSDAVSGEADDTAKPDEGKPSADPDARWGYKTAKEGEKELFFGYSAFAVTRVHPVGASADSGPKLVERILLAPAATDVVAPGLALIDGLQAGGQRVSEVLADRAWSYKTPDRWAHELRRRGVEQVVDLHLRDYGVTDQAGMRMVAGSPHCPAMPDDLVDIKRPATLGDGDELNEFIARIGDRERWALRRVAGADHKGAERYQCPALDGRVQCALRDIDPDLAAKLPLVANPPAVATAPACCKQATVTVPAAASAKVRQRNYWGSRKWVLSWRRRSSVEGSFGNLKNRNTENVTRGWAQVSGIVKTALLLAAKVAVSNLRLLRVWAARTGDFTDPLTLRDPEFLGFEELSTEPAVVTIPATGPPVLVLA